MILNRKKGGYKRKGKLDLSLKIARSKKKTEKKMRFSGNLTKQIRKRIVETPDRK